MKLSRVFTLAVIVALLFQSIPSVLAVAPMGTAPVLSEMAVPTDYKAEAASAILVDLNSDTILFSQDPDKQLYPASLTKIMTCVLALELGDLDETVTVRESAMVGLDPHGTTANLRIGETLPLRELLYCMMVVSANEACNAVAEHISGSVSAFVDLMCQKATALGMTGSHFMNTHGLPDDMHYTTVRDLAILCCYAWQNPDFQEIVSTTVHTVPPTNYCGERVLYTSNRLTGKTNGEQYYYPEAKGIKTGYTTAAGGCLATTAEKDGVSLLCIVCGCEFGSTDMRFYEGKRLLEYGFANYAYQTVVSASEPLGQHAVYADSDRLFVTAGTASDVTALLPRDYTPSDLSKTVMFDESRIFEAPLRQNQKVGIVSFLYQGTPVASADLVALYAVDSVTSQTMSVDSLPATNPYASKRTGSLVLAIVLILIGIGLIALIFHIRRPKKRGKYKKRSGRRPTNSHRRR